jgi:hypothetical protein
MSFRGCMQLTNFIQVVETFPKIPVTPDAEVSAKLINATKFGTIRDRRKNSN